MTSYERNQIIASCGLVVVGLTLFWVSFWVNQQAFHDVAETLFVMLLPSMGMLGLSAGVFCLVKELLPILEARRRTTEILKRHEAKVERNHIASWRWAENTTNRLEKVLYGQSLGLNVKSKNCGNKELFAYTFTCRKSQETHPRLNILVEMCSVSASFFYKDGTEEEVVVYSGYESNLTALIERIEEHCKKPGVWSQTPGPPADFTPRPPTAA